MKTVIDSGSRVCDFVYVLGCGTGLLKGVSSKLWMAVPNRAGERLQIVDRSATRRLLVWEPWRSLRDGRVEWYRARVEDNSGTS